MYVIIEIFEVFCMLAEVLALYFELLLLLQEYFDDLRDVK
jgi:hypothetical protein